MKRNLFILSAVLFSFALSQHATAEEVITFGFIGPLTGDTAGYGRDEKNAIEMALAEITASGLIPNTRFKVVYEDGKCSGKNAAIAARKLIDIDRVKVIFGGICSGETLAAAPVVEKAKVILFSVFSSHKDISQAGDFVFGTAPSDAVGGRKAAEYIAHRGLKRIAVITENTDYAIGLREAFVSRANMLGASIISDEYDNASETDFRPMLLRTKTKNPDSLFLNPQNGPNGGRMVRRFREMGWEIPLFGTFAFSTPDAHQAAGGIANLEGMLFVDLPAVETKKAQEFIKRYEQLYPKPQSEFEVALRYDSVYLLVHAIQKHGLNAEKIRDHLYTLDRFEGVAFNYTFDKNGDAVGIPYAVKKISQGKIELVE